MAISKASVRGKKFLVKMKASNFSPIWGGHINYNLLVFPKVFPSF